MAYRSGLFNSVNGDRKYQAAHFAEYFATFIGNGVFPNPSNGLQVYAKENMTVTIKPGKAWINGYYFVNDSDCDLKIENADGVLKRKDRIVLRFDTSTRLITPQIRKGVFSASPVAPTIQRDGDAYELALATVSIEKGTVTITQASIVDERLDTTVCGIVHGVVDQVDTATLFSQYQTWYAEKMEQYNTLMTNAETSFNNQLQAQQTAFDNQSATNQSAFDTQLSDNQSAFDNQTIVNQQTFDDWLASLQTILDGDVAGNLLNILNDLGNEVTNLKSGKGQKNGLASLDETGNVPITQLENVEDIFNSFSQKHNTILLNKRQLLSDLCANIENELRVSPIISALNFTEISTLMSDSSFFSIYYTYNSYSVDKTSGSVSTDEFGNYIFSLVGSYDSSGFSRTLNFETNAVYDFSKIDSLDFKVNLSSQGGTYAKIYVEIDDVEVYSKYGTDSSLPAELSIHIDTANINSKSKFSIKFYVLKNMYSLSGVLESVRINYQENVVNNVSLNSINELYLTKPSEQNNIVIPYIINADNDFIKWGSLIAFTTQPTDTFITFDILDEFNNLLVKDLINTDKIHHIKQTKLKIRINFSGNLLMNASVGKIALTSV